MTQQFVIKANITKAHKETLGFEYETRLVRSTFTWGCESNPLKIASLTTPQLSTPKKFNSEKSASNYAKKIEDETGMKILCPEEIAFNKGLISSEDLNKAAEEYSNSEYGKYLKRVVSKI